MTRAHARSLATALLFLGLMALPLSASAQNPQRTDFQVENFEPQYGQGANLLNLTTSVLLPHGSPSAGFVFHYSKDPLVLAYADDLDNPEVAVVSDMARMDVWAAFGIIDWFDVALVLPLVVYQNGEDQELLGRPGTKVSGFALGDLRFVPKVELVNRYTAGGFGMALAFPVHIPIGDEKTFNTDNAFRVQPQLILDYHHTSGFAIVGNVGYEVRPSRRTQNLAIDDEVQWGVGVEIPTGNRVLSVLLDVFGAVQTVKNSNPLKLVVEDPDTLDPDLKKNENDGTGSSMELLGALQFRLPASMVLQAGGGIGLNQGVGSPTYRLLATVGYTPSSDDRDRDGIYDLDDQCPDDPEDKDGFEDEDGCPDLDNDKDGIPDTDDKCPDDPEDRDDFEDQDGCPDNDNDQDGLADDVDKCPNQPEDFDKFEDEDGCPDTDNDKDGILDRDDQCPNEPEDLDGFEDGNGCPDPDNDQDKIPDVKDKCPNQPETYNGNEDEDGCPDTARVRLTKRKIEILEKVFFAYNKATIKEKSYPLLRDVASVVKSAPQITKIRVEGHTDDRGRARYNKALSQKRAEAVRDFLIEEGVPAERLEAVGYGEDKPLMEGHSKEARDKNRRVEFTIVEVGGKPVEGDGPVIIEEKKD